MAIGTRIGGTTPLQTVDGIHVGSVGSAPINYNSTDGINSQHPIIVEIRTRDNGLKRRWYWHKDDENCPIKSIQWDKNINNGLGACNITFVRVDFPIDANDDIVISYNGTTLYKGYIDSIPDPEGGKVKVSPPITKLRNTLYPTPSPVLGTENVNELIEKLIDYANNDGSRIDYIHSYNVISDKAEITFDENPEYKSVHSILEQCVNGAGNNYNFGVDENYKFYVKEKETTVSDAYYNTEIPQFATVEHTEDWTKVKNTRIVIKDKDGDLVTQVGYGTDTIGSAGDYPILTDIENKIGIREKLETVEKVTLEKDIADFFYTRLVVNAQSAITTKIKNINLDLKNPELFQFVRAQSQQKRQLSIVDDFDDITKMVSATPVTLDTDDYYSGNGSIVFNTVTTDSEFPVDWIYELDEKFVPNGEGKLGIMIKSSQLGTYLELSYGEFDTIGYGDGAYGAGAYGAGSEERVGAVLWETSEIVKLENSGWNYVEVSASRNFKFIGIRQIDRTINVGEVKINRAQFYDYAHNEYEGNIVGLSYTLDSNGLQVDAELTNLDTTYNDRLFNLEQSLIDQGVI